MNICYLNILISLIAFYCIILVYIKYNFEEEWQDGEYRGNVIEYDENCNKIYEGEFKEYLSKKN